MNLPIRHRMLVKLLGAFSLLTVCYLTMRLHDPSGWIAGRVSSPLVQPDQASLSQPTTTILIPSPQSTTTATSIPQKLWYKLGPAGLKDELRSFVDSCVSKNPGFEIEFMTDDSGDEFVKEHFASRPDIVNNFLAVTIPIIKADLLRYLILYEYGGTWNDLDVSCEVPIDEWIPDHYKSQASLVVGLEFDVDIWVRQFASWTIMAKPKSPHMLVPVDDCLDGLVAKAQEHNVQVQDLKLEMIDDIVDVSGPRRLTRGILKSLTKMLNETVGNSEISHVLEPRLIGDVLVLPDYAFADSMNQQHGNKKIGRKLTVHHYAGSWKNPKGGEEKMEE